MTRFFLGVFIACLLAPGVVHAQKRQMKTVGEAPVRWEPPDGEDGLAFSGLARVTLDVFFGEPTEKHIAGKWVPGPYAVYRGQRVDLAGVPEAVKKKLGPSMVDLCYDLQSSGRVVSTKCQGMVMDSDMAGSPNWSKMFPGLSASEAKDLYRSGFEIVNIRITKVHGTRLSLLEPYLGASEAAGDTPPPPETTGDGIDWRSILYDRDGDTLRLKHDDGRVETLTCRPQSEPEPDPLPAPIVDETDPDSDKVSDKCPVPGVGFRTMLPGPYCKFMTAACSTAAHTMDGDTYRQLGINTETVVFQFRRKGSQTWDTRAAGCGPLVQQSMGELRACAEYEVRSRALCQGGIVSRWSGITTLRTDCPEPVTPTLAQARKTSLDLSVRRPAGQCRELSGDVYDVQWAKVGEAWKTLNGTPAPFTLDGLDPNARYKVRVKRRDRHGAESEWSREQQFSTTR